MEWMRGCVGCLVDLDLMRLLLAGVCGGCWLGECGGDCEACVRGFLALGVSGCRLESGTSMGGWLGLKSGVSGRWCWMRDGEGGADMLGGGALKVGMRWMFGGSSGRCC